MYYVYFLIFIYLFMLCQVLVAACGIFIGHAGSLVSVYAIFLVVAYRIFSCGMHVGSISLPRYQTQAPCIGSVESQPLDHHYVCLFVYWPCCMACGILASQPGIEPIPAVEARIPNHWTAREFSKSLLFIYLLFIYLFILCIMKGLKQDTIN